ncbi:hypothetical protein Goari_027494 [Gossypium aridum]|uniref:DUF7745 domain-containing protein n=1 Tax=Gossypium aridum TaxID=34290 RepID=A0A7J8YLS2_GOSAI|nr:hypothetical protein [Gossypium aridum]
MIFPRALGYVDKAVTDLFDRLDKEVTPVPVILAETFRYLSACRSTGEGRFIGCAQLLLVWFYSHFWKVDKVSYRIFSKNYSPLKELVATPRRDNITMEKWIAILQNLKDEDVEWKAPCEFSFKDDGYKKKTREVTNAWKQIHQMKRLAVESMVTSECNEWWSKRVNDNIPRLGEEDVRSVKE